jgi:hypothetical protein
MVAPSLAVRAEFILPGSEETAAWERVAVAANLPHLAD